jgi:hypothetical protein
MPPSSRLKILEELVGLEWLVRPDQNREQVSTVRLLVPEGIRSALEQPVTQLSNVGLEGLKRVLCIRGQQAVVDDQFNFVAAKTQIAVELRLFFKTLARNHCAADGLFQTVLQRAVQDRFAAVSNAQAAISIVHAVIGFVADQDHSRACRHVTVIGNVEQKFFARALLNPTMKYANHRLKIELLRVLKHQLGVDVLDIHYGLSLKPPPVFPSGRSNCATPR